MRLFLMAPSVLRLAVSFTATPGPVALGAQAASSNPPCTIEACALWSDGFTLLRGVPGKPLKWDELRSSVAERPDLVPLAKRYYDARQSEEVANGVLWGVATLIPPAGWTAVWLAKTATLVAGHGTEDESSRLRREFLVAAGGAADPVGSAPVMPAPRLVLSKKLVVDARTGARVAVMRPFWDSLEPIRPLLGGNPEALRWFENAKAAQTRNRIAATALPISVASMAAGFGTSAAGGDDTAASRLFFGGLAGMIASITVKAGSERATRRSVGRALLYASPP